MQFETETEGRTYVEASRDGAVMLELDRWGDVLRVQLEPAVNATWTADMLSERLLRLYFSRFPESIPCPANRSAEKEFFPSYPPTIPLLPELKRHL